VFQLPDVTGKTVKVKIMKRLFSQLQIWFITAPFELIQKIVRQFTILRVAVSTAANSIGITLMPIEKVFAKTTLFHQFVQNPCWSRQ